MKKLNSIIALLLVATMLFGVFTVCYAQENEAAQNDTNETDIVGEDNNLDDPDGQTAQQEPGAEDGEGEDVQTGEPSAEGDGNEVPDSPEATGIAGILAGVRKVLRNGVPTLTTDTFIKIVDAIRYVKFILTGRIIGGAPRHFDVTMDEDVIAVCKAISDQSALDVYKLFTNLPDMSDPARFAGNVLKLDTAQYKADLYAARQKYYSEGNEALANICWLMGAYIGGIESAEIHLEPLNDPAYPGCSEIILDVHFMDGTVEVFHPEIYIDPETGECFGPDEKGMLRIGFNCNANDALVYAPMYCWMKDFGFCVEYDMLCYVLPMYCYNTRRFRFDYDGREWMVQIWKGNYMITNGGEVGIYNRPAGSFGTFYNVVDDSERMPMSLQISHDGELLVDIPEQTHWWVNGFKLGRRLYSPHTLQMTFTITFPNEEMMNAFTASVSRNFFHDVTYETDGLKVTLEWDT